ncbi:hypothetical protein D3C71_1678940 [compost metagenome]
MHVAHAGQGVELGVSVIAPPPFGGRLAVRQEERQVLVRFAVGIYRGLAVEPVLGFVEGSAIGSTSVSLQTHQNVYHFVDIAGVQARDFLLQLGAAIREGDQ